MNKTANLRRIQNEVKQMKLQAKEYENMFQINMVDDDMYHWQAMLYGPEDSLYDGYQFKLDIKLPENYPFSPINVKFVTPILHVNVNSRGDICLDILKTKWAPSQNIQSIVLSIRLLLGQPNTDDSFNADLSELYRTSKEEYATRIKNACRDYAIRRI